MVGDYDGFTVQRVDLRSLAAQGVVRLECVGDRAVLVSFEEYLRCERAIGLRGGHLVAGLAGYTLKLDSRGTLALTDSPLRGE